MLDRIAQAMKDLDAQVFEIDIERAKREDGEDPSAIFILKMSRENYSHSAMLSSVAELDCVNSVQEIIS